MEAEDTDPSPDRDAYVCDERAGVEAASEYPTGLHLAWCNYFRRPSFSEVVPSGASSQAGSSQVSTSQVNPSWPFSRSGSSLQVVPTPTLSLSRSASSIQETPRLGVSRSTSSVREVVPTLSLSRSTSSVPGGSILSMSSTSSQRSARLRGAYEACCNHVDRLTKISTGERLRATPYMSVLRSFGHIFRSSEGDACSYNLSRSVNEIHAFISHNWSAPALAKFLALCLHFNMRFAMTCTLGLAIVICILTACGLLPVFDFQGAPEGHKTGIVAKIACPIVFVCALCGKHELYRCLGIRGDCVFLDKTCIDQTDPHEKRKGIESLPAFIERSSKIVVVYTNEYIQRLWTVYELATFLILFPEKPIVVLPTRLPIFILASILAFMIQNLLPLLPFCEELGIARLVAWQLPMVILGVYMRFWARSLHDMQKAVDTFSVAKAGCHLEDDRPLVVGNIASYLRSSNIVPMSMKDDQVLKVFDRHVQQIFGETIRQAIGPMGIRYRWLMVLVWVAVGAPNMDYIGALLCCCEDRREVFISCVEIISWQMAGFALHWASVAVIAKVAVTARGIREILVVLASLFAGSTTTVSMYLYVSYTVLRPLAKESSAGLALFVVHHVMLFLLTCFIFSGYRCSAAPYPDDGSTGGGAEQEVSRNYRTYMGGDSADRCHVEKSPIEPNADHCHGEKNSPPFP
eukprot:TRINITY_DN19001_c0_g1_i2.p1 TRINITY_DN19001_c0_g1~~TRINITY_DN19001_c0_g1_i2.p1  ORF type:complete len:688 (+),score=70.79 TRINITY_DN19001_c0_g1_i2:179-2242(+)